MCRSKLKTGKSPSVMPPGPPKPPFFAHSLEGERQSLKDHLTKVARLARDRTPMQSCRLFAEIAGLLHDLGKYSLAFQDYINKDINADADGEEETMRKGPDHSSAGAQFLCDMLGRKAESANDPEVRQLAELLARMVGHCIAGHHAGLLDGSTVEEGRASLDHRLKKTLNAYAMNVEPEVRKRAEGLADALLSESTLDRVCRWIRPEDGTVQGREAFSLQFAIRMVFSAVVDGDRLDSERAMNPCEAKVRAEIRMDGFSTLLGKLEKHLATLPRDGEVNALRRQVSDQCKTAGKCPPGFFSLTVPTGGGKTLASLRFALCHVAAFPKGKRRIIYVMPYTTIIEQNADVFRRIFDVEGMSSNVLEHHASLAEEKETKGNRLLAENWDTPIVVTTSVQFFETLYGNRASRCRRLHSAAGSVIILDEAQTVPVRYLKAVTWALEELVRNWGCSVVFCTATQPVLESKRLDENPEDDIRAGIKGIHEIVSGPQALFRDLKRVEVKRLADKNLLTPKEVASRISEKAAQDHSVLAIVNTKKNAVAIYRSLRDNEKLNGRRFHLSTAMCPQHRLDTILAIRNLLARFRAGESVAPVVVSTQLIEAGVDFDFDVVFRAMAGIDSIAQAAGRCNREGRMTGFGEVFVYDAEENLGSLVDIIEAKRHGAATLSVLAACSNLTEEQRNPIGLKAVEEYFERLYWDRRQERDAKQIISRLVSPRQVARAAEIPFASVAADFRFIEQETIPVVVPYGVAGLALVERVKEMRYKPALGDRRMAQRFSVQLWQNALAGYEGLITELQCGIRILESTKHYDIRFGLLGPDALSVEDHIV